MALFRDVPGNTNLNRQFIIPVENLRKGVTAPTDNLRGTTPSVPVITFTATNELAGSAFTMPIDWDNGTFEIIYEWALAAVQLNNDTLDVTTNYIAWENEDNSGNSILKTSTALTSQITVTTAKGLAIGDVYRMRDTVPAADANNPLANVNGFAFELNLTNVTGVASADLISVCISYTASY